MTQGFMPQAPRACACGDHSDGKQRCSCSRASSTADAEALPTAGAPLDGWVRTDMERRFRRQSAIPPIVSEVLHSPGRPLDLATRAFMEGRFGQDFSQVHVHADARAGESARAVNALAYTVGRDVVFSEGSYEPHVREGSQLLAHELAHVVQQERGGASPPPLTGGIFEEAADAAASALVRGRWPISVVGASAPGLACQPQPGTASPGLSVPEPRSLRESLSLDERHLDDASLMLEINAIQTWLSVHPSDPNKDRLLSALRSLENEELGRMEKRGTKALGPEPKAGSVAELARIVHRARLEVQRGPTALADYDDADPLHDPSRLTDAQIEATDAYHAYVAMNSLARPMRVILPAEARLACRLLLRLLRNRPMPVVVTPELLMESLVLARSRARVTAIAEQAVGSPLGWVVVTPPPGTQTPEEAAETAVRLQGLPEEYRGPSDFTKWMLAGGRQPHPRTGRLNCFEMVLFSAFRAGLLTEARMRGIYTRSRDAARLSGDVDEFPRALERELRSGTEMIYDLDDPASPRPLRGDLVIFEEFANHVALATGLLVGGQVEVISHDAGPRRRGGVRRTTIEQLLSDLSLRKARFWSPIW